MLETGVGVARSPLLPRIPRKASFAITEIARILGLSRAIIYVWIHSGKLPAYGRPMRVRREDLINIFDSPYDYIDG